MDKDKQTPWGPLGYITYKRTYARPKARGGTEEFPETIDRIIKATKSQLKINWTEEEEKRLQSYLLNLKGMVAGRFLWQLGTKTVDKLGLLSLQNCAVVPVNEAIRPFTWTFEALMLGCGVGFNLQREYVYELPKPRRVTISRKDTKDADFIIPDSREGWVELLRKTLESHFLTGKGFSFSTVCIRGKGTPIAGFGGVASGPEPLAWGILQISELLNKRVGKKLRPIDVLDMMNILGYIVVSGNVRRSAMIAIGDCDDELFINAKRWELGNIPNWRAMSNNSVVCNDIRLLSESFWRTYTGGSEPYGLINLRLAKSVGRISDTIFDTVNDPNVIGTNPCQPEFATVITKQGVQTFKDISVGTEIWSKEGWTTILNKWSTGTKTVFKYITETGAEFVGTSNHKVETSKGMTEVSEAQDLLVIDGPNTECVQYFDKIEKIENLGEYEVFDITVDNTSHTYWTGGLSVSNCGEQFLDAYETCCLGELYLPNITSKVELEDLTKMLYRINKHSLSLPCHLPETEAIVHKNMRMGIGVTGYLEASEEQRSWLADNYIALRKYDIQYSAAHNWPESIKLTTVKPSGTLSLLAGVTSGVHPGFSRYYIRRIRIASNSPLAQICRDSGYPVEFQKNFDGTDEHNTVVVEFPCKHSDQTILAKDVSAIQQLEYVKRLQREWSDNAVSCTVYYRPEELPVIREYLEKNYNETFKSLSFLLHSEHGFVQAPLEEISAEEYERRVKEALPITEASIKEGDMELDECATGACPIK